MRQADHVAHLPAVNNKDEKFLLGVHFVEMTPELINTWRKTVQPLINKHYSKSPKPAAASAISSSPLNKISNLAVVIDAEEQRVAKPSTPKLLPDKAEPIEAVVPVGELNQLECAVGAGIVQVSAPHSTEVNAISSIKPAGARHRADVRWSWRFNYYLHSLYSYWCRKYRQGGESKAVCMVVQKGGRLIPIGMLTLVPDFTCSILGITKDRAYTWYLSDAPREFYSQALGLKKISHIAHALVDYTVQAGIEANQETTLVLRADADGGEHLKDFYVRIGLSPLPEDHPAISPGRGWLRGGYFKLIPGKTKEFCFALDVYRASRTCHLSSVGHA